MENIEICTVDRIEVLALDWEKYAVKNIKVLTLSSYPTLIKRGERFYR